MPKRGHLAPDTQPDLRGLAIKVLDVPGEKLQPDEQSSQDFILLNHPVFIVRNVQGFPNLAILGGGQVGPELLQEMAPTLAILKEAMSKTVYNPILVQYWSTTPYKLGSQAIKFSLKPQQTDEAPASPPTSENYLREALVHYLSEDGKEAVFDFLVQVFVNEEETPIEDPMHEWKAEDAPTLKWPPSVSRPKNSTSMSASASTRGFLSPPGTACLRTNRWGTSTWRARKSTPKRFVPGTITRSSA